MANDVLNAKREQAVYLTGRANKKISRLRSARDVEVAGTRYDPRKPRKVIARYTNAQLDAYNARVSQFLDRGTQFVGDIHRRPIPESEWRGYVNPTMKHKKLMESRYDSIKDLTLPGAPGNPAVETIAQRRARVKADRVMAGNPTVQDPFDPPVRKPGDITSRDALKKLTRDAKKKAAKGWDDKNLVRQIGEFAQMIKRVGNADLAARVAKLTTGQFFTLWNSTKFAESLSTHYEQVQLMLQGRGKDYDETLVDNAYADADRLVRWAEGLDLDFGHQTVRDSIFAQDNIDPYADRKKKVARKEKNAIRKFMTD